MEFLFDGPRAARRTFIFGHGAGGPMDSQFMNAIACGLAAHGIRVVRFEFPYMAARRSGRKRGAPDREPALLDSWREAVRETAARNTIIGGKSLGGRIASMVADELGVAGLICLGYPFHPPGQPQRLRTKHLQGLRTPTLIVQGTRDPLGNEKEVVLYTLSPSIRIEWLPDGDHSFKPRLRSGETEAGNIDRAIDLAGGFIDRT